MSADAVAVAHRLVGRRDEVRLLESLVARVDRGGAVVVHGEAGIGKTTLLEHVAEGAPGRTLWVRGVESEASVPFAALADLLLPLRHCFAGLPPAQRAALEVSLALRGGRPASPLGVCAAALGVLASAGEAGPLLVLVDDLHWVDGASQQVLLFVARRLAAERVVMLLAFRDQPGGRVVPRGVPAVHLPGLSADECRTLLTDRGVAVSAAALATIVELTGGNPLAVVETAAGAPAGTLSGSGAALDVAHLGPSLHRAWVEVVDCLPEPTRRALVVVAASRSGRLVEVEPVLADVGCALVDLAPAEERGLVLIGGHELTLRHPLLRSVILDQAPLAVRRAALRALAEAASAESKAWYRAAAATGPDARAAAGLADAAAAARERGDRHTSSRACARAAELTADRRRRAALLLDAATDAHLAGDVDLALAWCDEALGLWDESRFAADVAVVRGRATTWAGQPLRGLDLALRAGDAILPVDPRRAAALYTEGTWAALMAGRVPEMLHAARLAESAGGGATAAAAVVLGNALILAGRPAEGRRRLDAIGRRRSASRSALDVHTLAMLAQGWTWTEEYDRARGLLGAVHDLARHAGAGWIMALALGARAELAWWTGHWPSAYADATEALQWGEELHQVGTASYSLALLARIDAARGEVEGCRRHADAALAAAVPNGMDCCLVHTGAALGLAALGAGDAERAATELDRVKRVAEKGGLGGTNVVPFAGDLVEAHVRAGDGRAPEELAWLERRAAANGLTYPAAAAARCRGLLARDPESGAAAFAEARRRHDEREVPFERARTLLCEGEVLRRSRRAVARDRLREAWAIFDSLGARPWAARAEGELAATGARAVRRTTPTPDLDGLTPQEFQIARAVTGGLSNVEAAAALYVSRKTVEAHLTRVYRKLGVRSRVELARLVAPHLPHR